MTPNRTRFMITWHTVLWSLKLWPRSIYEWMIIYIGNVPVTNLISNHSFNRVKRQGRTIMSLMSAHEYWFTYRLFSCPLVVIPSLINRLFFSSLKWVMTTLTYEKGIVMYRTVLTVLAMHLYVTSPNTHILILLQEPMAICAYSTHFLHLFLLPWVTSALKRCVHILLVKSWLLCVLHCLTFHKRNWPSSFQTPLSILPH